MSASFPLIRQAISRALLATASLAAGLAAAQEPGEEIAEVVVTGSSIRGVEAPVGSNLMAVGRDVIWQVPHGETPDEVRNHPLLKGLNLPPTGSTGKVGVLVTKTLVIAGDGTAT